MGGVQTAYSDTDVRQALHSLGILIVDENKSRMDSDGNPLYNHAAYTRGIRPDHRDDFGFTVVHSMVMRHGCNHASDASAIAFCDVYFQCSRRGECRILLSVDIQIPYLILMLKFESNIHFL